MEGDPCRDPEIAEIVWTAANIKAAAEAINDDSSLPAGTLREQIEAKIEAHRAFENEDAYNCQHGSTDRIKHIAQGSKLAHRAAILGFQSVLALLDAPNRKVKP